MCAQIGDSPVHGRSARARNLSQPEHRSLRSSGADRQPGISVPVLLQQLRKRHLRLGVRAQPERRRQGPRPGQLRELDRQVRALRRSRRKADRRLHRPKRAGLEDLRALGHRAVHAQRSEIQHTVLVVRRRKLEREAPRAVGHVDAANGALGSGGGEPREPSERPIARRPPPVAEPTRDPAATR